MSTDRTGPCGSELNAVLGPLPKADGTAETNKERHPDGGYIFDEVPAWSESLVLAYALQERAAERERIARWLEGQGQPGYAHEVRHGAGA